MGVTIFRPGARLVIPGVRVMQTRASAASWWLSGGISAANCAIAYQPKGAADLASSYINLNNPGTNNAAPGTAPTWDATGGWTFNGSTQFLVTGVFPNSGWSAIFRFSNASGNGAAWGSRVAGKFFNIYPAYSGASIVYYANGGDSSGTTAGMTSGNFGIAGQKGYRNGVDDGITIPAWTGGATSTQVGIARDNGAVGGFWTGKIQAFAIYNITLTAGQMAALYTAMAAL